MNIDKAKTLHSQYIPQHSNSALSVFFANAPNKGSVPSVILKQHTPSHINSVDGVCECFT